MIEKIQNKKTIILYYIQYYFLYLLKYLILQVVLRKRG